MSVLICGSMAYDTIMVFHDRFGNHILPDKIQMLNVSFLVPDMRREFGGCAGNIAYNLKLLGGDPLPMATVGTDFAPYRTWLKQHGIDMERVLEIPDTMTAQAFVTTDLDNNQITAFHPGAMMQSHAQHAGEVGGVELAIISPDGRDGMLQHARELSERGTPFIFDPGQAMPLFNGEEFRSFIEQADYVIANDYESNLLRDSTGWDIDTIAGKVKAYIVTQGPQGSTIYTRHENHRIPPAKEEAVVDPTGCGDAYRAGLIHGLVTGMDLPTCGRMASLMGAIKIAHAGTQNQHFTRDAFMAEFERQFGYTPS